MLGGGGLAALMASASAAAIAQTGAQTASIEEIEVIGRAQTFYQVKESSIGTKTDTPLIDIPQSIQVLPRQLIEDQAARQITDLYRSISGVSQFSYSGVTFRGFRQDEIRYDGVEGDPFGGFSVPQLFNIEQVEILKGPASVLYGGGEPGGLINYVTKKPQAERSGTFTATGGNFSLYGFSGEYTGALDEPERLRVRIGGFYESKEPWRFGTRDENTILDAGVAYQLTSDTDFLTQFTYVDQDLGGNRLRGVPVDDDGNFLTDRRWNHNEPTDFQNLEALVFLSRLTHNFNNGLNANITFRYLENERVQNYHEPRGLVDLDGDGVATDMRREFRDQLRENYEWSITADLTYDLTTGSVEHTLLLGADYQDIEAEGVFRTAQRLDRGGPVPNLDLLNPVYGLTSGTNYDLASLTPRLAEDTLERFGVYVQDQVQVTDQLLVLAGLRYNDFTNDNLITDETFSDDTIDLRGGVIFKPREDVSLYASYTEGFQPQNLNNQDAGNGPFEPEESWQVEAGIKTELLGGRFQTNAAVYQITKTNVLQPDPNGEPGDLIAFGEVRSRGFELDFVGDVTDVWVVTANYAYNDTKIIENAGTSTIRNSVGDRFANAPKHQFGFWSRYDIDMIDSAIAGGVNYVSEQFSLSGQTVKPYATVDVSWQTDWKDLNFQLNVRNLFDKTYATSGFLERTGHFPGEPRTVVFQVSAAL